MTLRPSTADSTEIAGVIMLSPKNSDAPKMPEPGQHIAVRRPRLPRPAAQQRDQRHDPALAVVVGAHHQRDVGQRHDDHHGPEDRDTTPYTLSVADRHRVRVAGIEHRLDRVDRAGADVAEDHPERADHDGSAQALSTSHGSHRCECTLFAGHRATTGIRGHCSYLPDPVLSRFRSHSAASHLGRVLR